MLHTVGFKTCLYSARQSRLGIAAPVLSARASVDDTNGEVLVHGTSDCGWAARHPLLYPRIPLLPEFLCSLREADTHVDLNGHVRVGLNLLRHQGQGLIGDFFGNHDYTVEVTHQVVTGVDGYILAITLKFNGNINRRDLDYLRWWRSANVPRKHLFSIS